MKNKRCIQINLYSKNIDICLFVPFIPTSSKPNYLIPSLKNASYFFNHLRGYEKENQHVFFHDHVKFTKII